jgi:F-type H+-transporting ATPase subunit epsilon
MIEVDIVTPSRRILEGAKVERVSLPTESGIITVLPGHAELVTLLNTGLLTFPTGGTDRKFVVSYGFAMVRKNKVIVLAETCEEASEIDLARAKTAQKKAEQALASAQDELQQRKYQMKLQRSLARQQASIS